MTLRLPIHPARPAIEVTALIRRRVWLVAAAIVGLAVVMLPVPASAEVRALEPHMLPGSPELQLAPRACSSITSFSPASARPGQQVDIHIHPGSGPTLPYSISGVEFANSVSASFSRVSQTHVRATVPLASSLGKLRVKCTGVLGSTWTVESASDFAPIAFGNTLSTNALTLFVGNNATVTATLSHPAPEPVTLRIAPPSNAVSVNGLAAGAAGTVTIPAGQQSASFTVTARAAGVAAVSISGHNVAGSTLTVTIPEPRFSVSVPNNDATAHWGNSATYSVQLSSQNGFAGQVTLTATGLPFGSSAPPVNVNVPAGGSATGTLTVATTHAATALGPDSFTLRAESPGLTVTRTLNLRVLPQEGAFSSLSWQTGSSTCGDVEADASGGNITFDSPEFARTQAHALLRYAFTPGCRGAVVMGPSAGPNAGWPMSIFNFGFDNAIADAPGSRFNLGLAAWNHNHFKVSPDGSYVIGVAQSSNYNANLYNMLGLHAHPPQHAYSITGSLSASIVGEEVQVVASTSDDWEWTLP